MGTHWHQSTQDVFVALLSFIGAAGPTGRGEETFPEQLRQSGVVCQEARGTHLQCFAQLMLASAGPTGLGPTGTLTPEQPRHSGVYFREAFGTHWHQPRQVSFPTVSVAPSSEREEQFRQFRVWFQEGVGTHWHQLMQLVFPVWAGVGMGRGPAAQPWHSGLDCQERAGTQVHQLAQLPV